MNSTLDKEHLLWRRRLHYLMGTFFQVDIFDPDPEKTKEVAELVFHEVARIERLLSRFREESAVYQLNRYAFIEPQPIAEELFHLIETSLEYSHQTKGAFDIAAAALTELWEDAVKKEKLPTLMEIKSFLPKIGYRNVVLNSKDKTLFFKSPLVKIDFGAIGKGYALDRAVEIVKREGILKAKLNFGGQLYFLNKLEEEAEEIGIRNPQDPDEILLTFSLINQTIATSANYERYFEIEGRRYGHLIDPRWGYPVENEVLSVSVVTSNAMAADAFSTAIFVLGPEEGMKWIEKSESVKAIMVINSDGKLQVKVSSNTKEIVL